LQVNFRGRKAGKQLPRELFLLLIEKIDDIVFQGGGIKGSWGRGLKISKLRFMV
jgi:hypothetical protein